MKWREMDSALTPMLSDIAILLDRNINNNSNSSFDFLYWFVNQMFYELVNIKFKYIVNFVC